MDSDSSPTPTRRALLRAGGLGTVTLLAGCVTGGPGGGGSGSPTPTPSPTPSPSPTASPTSSDTPAEGELPGGDDEDAAGGTRPAGTGGPAVSLVSTAPAPDIPLQPAVELVAPVATAEAPPRLRATLTNTSDQPVRVGEGRDVLFQYVHDDRTALVLLPPSEYDAEPDCWRLDSAILTTEEFRVLDLAPGETAAADLDLYASAGGDACLPVGEHRFETRYQLVDEERIATWGFTVLLE